MDPFEEFEFKPITEGLGFHRKKIDLQKEVQDAGFVQQSLTKAQPPAVPEPLLSQKPNRIKLETPLPRPGNTPVRPIEKKPSQQQDLIDDIVRSFKRPQDQFIDGALGKQEKREKKHYWTLSAFMVDFLMVTALFLVCLIVTLFATKVDLLGLMLNSQTEMSFFVAVGLIFVGMGLIYALIFHMFNGATIGEEAFDLHLSTAEERQKPGFALKAAWRTVIVAMTGVITLPILSFVLHNDLAGKLSGAHLTKKV